MKRFSRMIRTEENRHRIGKHKKTSGVWTGWRMQDIHVLSPQAVLKTWRTGEGRHRNTDIVYFKSK